MRCGEQEAFSDCGDLHRSKRRPASATSAAHRPCCVEALITGARVSAEARKRRDLRPWLVWLCALAAVRAAIPLVALAFGGLIPGFPAYSYEGPQGDASGYIATARAIISAGASPLLPVLLVVAVVWFLLGRRTTT